MKIYKKNEHSLMIKPFGVRNTLHLACTVFIFFDLNDPDRLLSEQELWKTVPDELGQGEILDLGMPKPRGEVLITGKCHAPRGKTRFNSQVSFRVGDLEKKLDIFANRYWKRVGAMMHSIAYLEPFGEMPITWENAFGGKAFEMNPTGKGIDSVRLANGAEAVLLPNIENPKHLLGAPSDRPEPAGYGPIDVMRPQRFEKQGTYDGKWQLERWPYFPDDMNYEFFNIAPGDQFLDGFFKGDEAIEIVNMHPDIQMIQSRLPQVRLRCFVTKKKEIESDEEIFAEAKTRIDTVWLFPRILRGVIMYRGTTEILDDEYADVVRIFVATEKMSDPPKAIDDYLEAQRKMLDRGVPIDPAPIEAAQKKLGEAVKKFKRLPKDIEAVKRKAMGKTPKSPLPTPQETAATSKRIIANSMSVLDNLEAQARKLQAQHGHVVRVPLEKIDAFRAKLKKTEARIDKTIAKLEKAQQQGDAAKKQMPGMLKEKMSPGLLATAGVDPMDLVLPEKSVNPWHDRGFPFVVACRKNLQQDPEALNKLYQLGFTRRTIKRSWLGYNPEEKIENPESWGLTPRADAQGRSIPLTLPKGIIIPRFDEATLNRILIRPDDYERSENDALIQGSDETPLFLPAATLIDLPTLPAAESAPVVRLADEMQALYVEQEIGDACSVIVLRDAAEKPDKQAAKAIEAAPVLLVVLPEGEISDAGWAPWKKAFPNAQKLHLPKGDTVFAARKAGTDIRTWIMEALPPEIAREHQVEPQIPKPGTSKEEFAVQMPPLPLMNIKGMVKGLIGEIKAFHQPKFDAMKSQAKQADTQVKALFQKAGQTPDVAGQPQKSFTEVGNAIAKKINADQQVLRSAGKLTPETESRMNTAARQSVKMGKAGDQKYQEGVKEIEAGKKRLAEAKSKAKSGALPDKAKEKLKAVGLDPDKIKRRTREEVIEMHGRGASLSGAILSGVDLSELDLHGIDLGGAQCRKTKFCGSNLEGADFSQAIAQEADFTKASLRNMHAEKGIFSKAIFKEANLSQADLSSAVLQKADLTRADCTGARLYMTTLQKSQLTGVKFRGSNGDMCVFSDAGASDADFREAKLNKCLFKRTTLDRADFSNTVLESTMFYEAKGESVKFTGADMSKSRMGGKTALPGADFNGIKMTQGCFKDSDLSGAVFQGSTLELAMLENCDLRGGGFYRVSCIKTRFAKSNLEGADMRGVNLFLGSLRKARLVNADLRGSNLFGVDFYKAVLGGTRLDKANLKMTLLHGRTEYLS